MARLERGYLLIGRVRGLPIRVHWSAPIGAVVLGGFRYLPGFWLGFFALILIHELGHAVVARRSGARVATIAIHGAGGFCRWSGSVTAMQQALIAWGGIFGQAVALLLAIAALAVLGPPRDPLLGQLADVFTRANLWLAAFNLLPVPFLDGSRTWKIVPLLLGRARARAHKIARRWRARRAARREVARLAVIEAAGSPEARDALQEALGRIAADVNGRTNGERPN